MLALNSAETTSLTRIIPFRTALTLLAKFVESATDLESPSDYIYMMILATKSESDPWR
jgi:hypothetical protein